MVKTQSQKVQWKFRATKIDSGKKMSRIKKNNHNNNKFINAICAFSFNIRNLFNGKLLDKTG